MSIAAVILAAGQSRRFGKANKLTAELDGRPVAAYALEAAAKSRCDGIVLVVPPDHGELLNALRTDGAASFATAVNEEAATGMASSIRAGIAALPGTVAGALLMLADMPHITPGLIDLLIEAFEASGGTAIVFPETHDGARGHPVIFPAQLFDELKQLKGDVGARPVIEAHADLLCPLAVQTDAVIEDIDTPQDLERATEA